MCRAAGDVLRFEGRDAMFMLYSYRSDSLFQVPYVQFALLYLAACGLAIWLWRRRRELRKRAARTGGDN